LPARIFTGENSAPFQGTHPNAVDTTDVIAAIAAKKSKNHRTAEMK
jgi:hypothetical protein